MANFFKANSSKQTTSKISPETVTVSIDKLDLNGCGVGRYHKKPIFVDGALSDEIVDVRLIEQKNKYVRGKLLTIKTPSKHRAAVKCKHFTVCGGCDLQHLAFDQQLAFKQKKIIELFYRHDISSEIITDLPWQTAIVDKPWHYRRKARIGVQFTKKSHPIIGFRQKGTNQLAAIKSCPVLVEPLNNIFPILQALITQLTIKSAIGHIEIISSNDLITLVVRQLKSLNKNDRQLWQDYAHKNSWNLILDNGKNLTPLSSCNDVDSNSKNNTGLSYALLDDITLNFSTNDFIQINEQVNVAMVQQALAWLQVSPNDKVLDLFCGLGNFSLAMAKKVNLVLGVEGVQAMVDKASINAKNNHIENCHFHQADLNSDWSNALWLNSFLSAHQFTKVLLDPARAGAEQAVMQISQLRIPSVLYVSCDPATLARDTQILLTQGYKIQKISLIDMFSQTKHIETMVLFER
ncbi:MAG: 23S rRNA (uracil(1939)-C(5))-methyltransferase RlmD [Colwellia sp.]